MGKQKSGYESLLDKLTSWGKQTGKNESMSIAKLFKQAKAYLRAAEDLSVEEIRTLENFLLRDLKEVGDRLAEQVDDSLWWQNTKIELWQLIGQMSDHNQLDWYEMQQDLAHQGIYKAGELVAIGKLVCSQCGQSHEVNYVERILPCIECGNETFTRKG
jgi:hypothetical protein